MSRMCPGVGCGVQSSYPAHISNMMWPKQMVSMAVGSLLARPHITGWIRDVYPNKVFSSPVSLRTKQLHQTYLLSHREYRLYHRV
jgi:hypothetical protein